jgi:hypothetical protein
MASTITSGMRRLGPPKSSTRAMTVADFDGDSHLDIAARARADGLCWLSEGSIGSPGSRTPRLSVLPSGPPLVQLLPRTSPRMIGNSCSRLGLICP